MKEDKFPSELRLDKASGNWVVIATGRAKRPESFKKAKDSKLKSLKKDCFFCNIETQEDPLLIYYKGKKVDSLKKWTTVVIPNKFPAFVRSSKLNRKKKGEFFETMNAVGAHEVVVTKNHNKSLGQLSLLEVKEVIDVYADRYNALIKEDNINYVAIFHNHGPEAGASMSHPHSQIAGIPLIDYDLKKALAKSKKYKKDGDCIYCKMNDWEIKEKERIVYQNKHFMAICPFASKVAFQVIISPKKHLSHFENITEAEKESLADIFRVVLKKLYKSLGDPAYNFYLHSAPSDNADHSYYHWHWTILPKTSIWAGFELGVGIEISTIDPEEAAKYLRNQKV